MKISPVANQAAVGAYKKHKTAAYVGGYLPYADRVSVSEEVIALASTIGRIKETMDTRTPEELARIEEIARQIREGSYHVSSDKVAAKIVDEYLHIK